MQHATPAFFGYGSLVNRATHSYPAARPARLTGWRRVWRHTLARRAAYLSVTPAPGTVIDGLIAKVPGADWGALDAREAAYRRVLLDPASVIHGGPRSLPVHLYHTEPETPAAAAEHPILLSYLDVVIQGFLDLFDVRGVERFFATTDGWRTPVLDDRARPEYPRHVPVSAAARALTDAWLVRVRRAGASDAGTP